ncbi:MAG: NAD(P)H-dependent oxidoreductase subunit E [Acidimicrobiia bacterium]
MTFSPANLDTARGIIARYPFKRSALLPLLHLAQDQDGWVKPEAIEEVAGLLDMTPALVLGTASFYTMFKLAPVGKLVVSVCTNYACIVNRAPQLLTHLEHAYADNPDITVEEVECIAACDQAPVMQVNYDYHGPVTPEAAAEIVNEYARGARVARSLSGSLGSAE